MKKEVIQNKIEKLRNKKEEIEEKINSLKQDLEKEDETIEWIKIPNTNYEVTKQVLHKGKSYDEIMELKNSGEELLTLKLIGMICEHPDLVKELKMDSSSTKDDFFFKQPFPQNEKKGYVPWFYADSGCAGLYCFGGSGCSGSSLGVRFVRKISKK